MILSKQISTAFILFMAVMLFSLAAHAETAFTYQGQLSQAGQPAEGQYDMTFALYDADNAGNQVGVTLNQANIEVTDGVFDVLLDFGDAPFNSAPRWLQIAVREAGGSAYTTLSPRQRVGASPFAIETLFVAPGAVDTAAIQNGAVTRAKIANDAIGTFQVENNTITSNDIRNGTIKNEDIANGGGLLHRKEEMQRMVSELTTVAGNSSSSVSATCADENDIPIAYECFIDTTVHLVVLREVETVYWDVSTDTASVTCSFQNQHSTIAAQVGAAMICLQVP